MGTVVSAVGGDGLTTLAIEGRLAGEPLVRGESISVDGVCLTVVDPRETGFTVQVIAESLERTTLGRLAEGDPVNLERALRLGGRLGGHLVQGHVDTTAEVLAVERDGEDHRLALALPAEIRHLVAYKGSVALQGVSLTVASVSTERFTVALIPETLSRTTLGQVGAGNVADEDEIGR